MRDVHIEAVAAPRMYGPYRGLVREVHDGDTVYVDLDLGFGHTIASKDWDGHPWLSCRVQRRRDDGSVIGINAPELRTPDGDAAAAYAQRLLQPGDRVTVMSSGWDKYGGRFDGLIDTPSGKDFGSLMVEAGHAVEKDFG